MAVYDPKTPSHSDADSDICKKISLVYFNNDFPSGDLHEQLRHLRNHAKDNGHPVLSRFIAEATRVVKEEIHCLPAELKALIPPFDNILSWSENAELREGLICGAVEGVLLVVLQLAAYIG